MRVLRHLAALLALLALTACADEAAPGAKHLAVPDLGEGKADRIEQVTILGDLEPGAEHLGHLEADGRYDGLLIDVGEGARITLEITERGSAAELDTALFVYGPKVGDSYGTEPVVWDDDSGWGALSKIVGYPLTAGEYLVAIGTAEGLGSGDYRLTLRCDAGHCGAGAAVALTPFPLSGEVEALLASAGERCGDYCAVEGAAFQWTQGDPSLAELIAAAGQDLAQPGAPWQIEGEGDASWFEGELNTRGLQALPDALAQLTGGADYELGFATYAPPSGDALGSAWVLVYRQSRVVVVLDVRDFVE